MGIHGLTSFIDNNPHLLKDRQLHDCRVVVDGNNFYHFLYFYCNVRYQFGGDFDVFQRKISMIFNMFKSCNIEVFVVFDGAYTVDGKKFKTTMGRARDRLYASQRIMNGQRGVLIPCLAQQTFRQTLDKLGIPHVTCDFEADNQLAILANRWNCPVISNDSDFYIFDLSGGFIPLDYIDFRPQQMTEKSHGSACSCLPVQYYHVDEFINCFKSLNRSVLPLFATMLGNDYVNAAAFEAFYQKTPKIASRRYSASKKHHKIVSVLYWLEEKGHKEELVSEVLSFIRPERREHVQKLLSSSISGYLDTQEFESFDLRAFLEGDQSAAMQRTDAVVGVTGEGLSPWFVAACRRGEMPGFLLNAVLLHRVVLPTQVESVSLPAAFSTSRAVREVMYGLLLGDDESPLDPPDSQASSQQTGPTLGKDYAENGNCTGQGQPETTNTSKSQPAPAAEDSERGIVEYTRHNMELRRIAVPARAGLPFFGPLPSLEKTGELGREEKLALVTETLGVNAAFVGQFEPSLQLYFMCLALWAKHAEPPVSLHLLKGILLSAVLLHMHAQIADRERQVIEDGGAGGDEKKAVDTDIPRSQKREKAKSSSEKSPASTVSDRKSKQQDSAISETAQASKNDRGATLSIAETCQSESDKVLGKVRDNLKKYYHDPVKINNKNPPEAESFHGTAQFLACLLDGIHLNCLLSCPFPSPQPAQFFNGTLVYAIVHELQQRSNPDLFLCEMLVKGSSVMALFDALCSAVMREVGDKAFAEKRAQGRKCCKSSKKRKKQQALAAAATQGKQSGEERVRSVEGQDGHMDMVNCDLSNRFGVLLMDAES